MTSIRTKEPVFGGSICAFIAKTTFTISEDISRFLPQFICDQCLDMLRFFAKYRRKMETLHLFLISLVELRSNNTAPILDLFMKKATMMKMLLKDLELYSRGNNVGVQELIDEFPSYAIASMPDDVWEENVTHEKPFQPPVIDIEADIEMDERSTESGMILELIEEITVKSPSASVRQNFKYGEKNSIDNTTAKVANTETVLKQNLKYGGKKSEHPIQCDKCKFSTYYPQNMRNHHLVHKKRESRIYRCKEEGCTESFDTIKLYRSHLNVVHKDFVCEICGFKSSTKSHLRVHRERHLDCKNFRCPYCNVNKNTRSDLRTHIKHSHEAIGNYPCDVCGLEFKRKTIRDDHLLTHSNVYNFPCGLCDKKFKNRAALKKHKKCVHERIKLQCDYCSRAYNTPYKLNDHIESVHGVQKRFPCDICVHNFESLEKLDDHKQRHVNPQELQCGICLGVFTLKALMTDHLCITYRDDYVCCERDFRYHYPYNKHMLTKHGVKINARVKPIPGLLVGRMRAQRKRVESCPKCERIFATRTLKKQHLETCNVVEAIEDDSIDNKIGLQ